ncbi:MAG TPA: hypothetical protein PKM43_20455 [Verrucomicrobiota bacterium]|nr:hypothetical protein [Verrucomicrobiota bacterium]HRZ35134.1 hypothetical protein [Candidatus Paceibacterota bacterium]HRZ57563.1 hypothetical protein [Candidatus Paceibacterota bacterium]
MSSTDPKPKPTGAHTGTRWSLVRRLKAGGDELAWQENAFEIALGQQ